MQNRIQIIINYTVSIKLKDILKYGNINYSETSNISLNIIYFEMERV